MDADKVLKLATLSRIRISQGEAEKLSHEFEAILKYVGEVKEVSGANSLQLIADSFALKNIMREDGEGHEPGIHTEVLLAAAPAREGNYIKVKKIL